MKRFLPYFAYLREVQRPFLTALFFGVVHGAASGFGLPFATEKVFPALFSNPDPSIWTLVASVAILPAAFLVRGVAGYINGYLLNSCGLQVLKRLQLEVYRKIQSLPLQFFHVHNSGDLMARILGDTNVLQQTLTVTANNLIKQPITLIGAIGALIYFSFKHHELFFILLCLGLIPVLILPIRYTGRKLAKKAQKLQAQAGVVTNVVQENLAARKEVRIFNLQVPEAEKFRTQVETLQKHSLKVVKYDILLRPSVEFLSTIGVAVAVLYASRTGVPLDTIIPLIVALFMSYQPLKSFGVLHNQLKRGQVSLDRLEMILHQEDALKDPDRPLALRPARGAVEFRGVSFGYNEDLVLRDLDLTVAPGEIVALVGPSGAGKTSFANLIPRLYDATRGEVLIDGKNVRECSKFDVRDQIAIVPQDPVLFNDSVRNNILIGREGATEEEVIHAAKQAFAQDFIEQLPYGYRTPVGEWGTRLSGGQKQRIAIARAFLKDAPILILDEATSNLDSQSEAMIQKSLTDLVRGRTTFIIAHRFSTLKIAQRILVFEDGKIIAGGSSEELLAQSDRYRALYELQAGHPRSGEA